MSIKTERLLSKAKKLAKKGENKQAKDIYSHILKNFPNNQIAKKEINLLGKDLHPTQVQLDEVMRFYATGDIKNALDYVESLIKDYPNESLLFNICGACHSEIGSIEPAIENFKKAIALKIDYSEAQFNLGVAFQKLNQLDNASEYYLQAIHSQHAYPSAHNNLGIIFLNKSRIDAAVKSFEWAIAYSPNYAEAYNNLGSALQELKQFKNAKKQFEKACSINPNYAQAFHNLGILSEITNQPKEAVSQYERAVEIEPEFAEAYRNLSKVKKFKVKDPQINQVFSLYSGNKLNVADKARLGFALADINKSLGNHDDYIKYLNEGNRLRKEEIKYSFEESQNFHSIITKLFSSTQPIIKTSSKSISDIKPIFIVGMPRSGTSLVEQIISSHKSVHGAGELLNFRNIITPILDNHLSKKNSSIPNEDMLKIRNEYLDSLGSLKAKEKIITDKMPMNFRLLGFILSAIPEAKIIHLTRDPMATCWSNFNHYFTAGNGFSFDQEDLAKFYLLYQELMNFWHKLFPNKIYDLNYENLTINQEKETKKLIKYCDLEWDENCLDFHKNQRGVLTASSAQVRKKMYQGSSEAWKKYEKNLQPLIKGLGIN
ncbi:sulfotransferase [Candidatus Pseudothioglobus singularis]|nr:sulfotransferase [Candidatus Pseudothioglobus singularis]